MGDLIDRQMAIEIIQSMYPGMPRTPWMQKDWQKRYEPYIRTENAIRELPPAQTKRKEGRWIRIDKYDEESNVQCSAYLEVFDYIDGVCYLCFGHELPLFCPNCGAKMKGKELNE